MSIFELGFVYVCAGFCVCQYVCACVNALGGVCVCVCVCVSRCAGGQACDVDPGEVAELVQYRCGLAGAEETHDVQREHEATADTRGRDLHQLITHTHTHTH